MSDGTAPWPARLRPRRRCGAARGRARRGATSCLVPPARGRPGRTRARTSAARATPTERPTPNCFTVGSAFSMKLPKTDDHDERGRDDHARAAGEAAAIASGRSAARRGAVRSARSGTPGSPSRARTGRRTSSAARSSRSGRCRSRCRARRCSRPQPFWKTAVSTPNEAVTDSTFATAACAAKRNDRNAASRMQKLSPITTAITRTSRDEIAAGEVDVARRLAADVRLHIRALGRLRDRVLRGASSPGRRSRAPQARSWRSR